MMLILLIKELRIIQPAYSQCLSRNGYIQGSLSHLQFLSEAAR